MAVSKNGLLSSICHPMSLLKCLKKGHNKRVLKQKRRFSYPLLNGVELLEDRTLLSGTSLISVTPNSGDELYDGVVLNESPAELVFKFEAGKELDPSTLGGIQITRGASSDITVSPTYVGIGDTPNEVIVRFGETLPEDVYQITVFGSNANPLMSYESANAEAEEFLNGFDTTLNFELDLAPKITAVVPQPVTRSDGSIDQSLNTIEIYFEGEIDENSAINPAFYQLINTTDNSIISPEDLTDEFDAVVTPAVVYDSASNKVTLTFAENLSNGTYHLRVGESIEPAFTAAVEVTISDDDNSSFDSTPETTGESNLGTLGSAGRESIHLSSSIEKQNVAYPDPAGSEAEPGHRNSVDSHYVNEDTYGNPEGEINTVQFYFPQTYQDHLGNTRTNQITEAQKQRVREIYELFASVSGLEVQEINDPQTADSSATKIITGDVRAVSASLPTSVTGGSLRDLVVINGGLDWGNSEYGGEWFKTALHEIGHSLGLGDANDLPSMMNSNGSSAAQINESIYLTDHDIVHLNYLYPAQSNDIDLYKFTLENAGILNAEITAERITNDPELKSQLDSVLSLYNSNHELIARNDNYFGKDSFLELELEAGDYYLAVTSVGNTNFNPEVSDSGAGGKTDGQYELNLNFQRHADTGSYLADVSGTQLDGDGDGTPGGVFDFWFEVGDTIFVDKANTQGGQDGSLMSPYQTISDAIDAVTIDGSTAKIIRIIGNNGSDGMSDTLSDNLAYEIGFDDQFQPMADGVTFEVPAGVTVMIDAGAIIKLQNANIDVGSNSLFDSRSGGALQILGTPDNQVYLTSFSNDTIGLDSNPTSDTPTAGDWGGIVFRADSDREESGIFLNSINNADISYGGGRVFVNTAFEDFAPIQVESARPKIWNSSITHSANVAISADLDSFEDSRFVNGSFTLNRHGLEIRNNRITDNSVNGLFVQIDTPLGGEIDKLDLPAIFDDDITYLINENLHIAGAPAGQLVDGFASVNGRLKIAAGTVIKLDGARIEAERGNSQIIAEGTAEHPIIFTSWNDDRYGKGITFDTTNDGYHDYFSPGSWGGIIFNASSRGSIDHALITNAGGNTPLDNGFAQFNPIEVHQADLRLTNSLFENNSGGFNTDEQNNYDDRNGRGVNESATIFIRDSQSIIVNNSFRNNAGAILSIDVNSLNSEFHEDYGTTTGILDSFDTFADNQGALVRLNRMDNNGMNGMKVRGGVLTTESVWDDTDIVHILQDEVVIDQHHTYSGLRLKSSHDASLIVKLAGDAAGFTATGIPLDSEDRIGGTIQIIGQPEYAVILTSLNDDSVGASLTPEGILQTDTWNDGSSTPSAGDWRSIRLDSLSNDRNVVVRFEEESTYTEGEDLNKTPFYAQKLGILAPDQLSGDENQVLGFEVHGSISADTTEPDQDVYSFQAMGGTEVWIDIDRSSSSLDTVVELVDIFGRSLVLSDNSATDASPTVSNRINSADTGNLKQTDYLGGDYYSQNKGDAGFWVRLPDPGNNELGTYFIRVTSAEENGETTSGQYQLQIRLRQVDEKPGSTVRYADIRYATNGIEIIGLPANSPLLTDAAEKSGDNNSIENAQNLGNLLTHDQGTISVSGTLNSSTDVDWYTFELGYDLIDVVNGLDNAGKSLATIFDIDYADGLSRPDTTLSVFDENGTLILISRDSNIEDDQANGDQTDLSSGSFGTYDPYIGAVNLAAGNPGSTFKYHVAISSNSQLPLALNATFSQDAANPLIRLEPVSSIKRIVEDHIGFTGFTSGSPYLDALGTETVDPENGAIFDISNAQSLDSHVAAFTLADVKLFVSSNNQLLLVDPYDGRVLGDASDPANAALIGALSTDGLGKTQDITIRSDGKLFSYESLSSQTVEDVAGRLNELDPGSGSVINQMADEIPDVPAGGTKNDPVELTTEKVEALAFQRMGIITETVDGLPVSKVDYNLFYSVYKDDDTTTLYRADPTTGQSGEERLDSGNNQQEGDDSNDSGSGSQNSSEPKYSGNLYTVIGDIVGYDSLGDAINQAQMGRVTGMTFAGVNATIDQAVLYGITSTGLFVSINHDLVEEDLSLSPAIAATVINDLSAQIEGNFTGLTTAPQNLHNGAFKNFLFAVTDSGNLYAINPLTGELITEVDINPDPGTEEMISVFTGGATHINIGVNGATGLAFSPLDFNLWHPTFKQGDAAGHGINNTYDPSASLGDTTRTDAENISRTISDLGINQTEQEGGASFYFGFEELTADGHFIEYTEGVQYGVQQGNFQKDLATNPDVANTYNFAGGAHGSLISSTFDLGDHDPADKPTLYFNYYLETEDANSLSGDMQDAARVFVGYYDEFNVYQWVEVATNNSVTASPLSPDDGELSSFLSASAREGSDSTNGLYENQHVQELFEPVRDDQGNLINATWRQARVDLSAFVGKGELKLRFDFSTAGAITNDQSMPGDEFGNFNGNGQAKNNKYEGFYIDDIIVGFTERGETVTGATSGLTGFTSTPSNPHPSASQDIAIGPYLLQIRQASNYAVQPNGNYPGTVIESQYDTNDRFVPELGLQGDLNPVKQQGQIVIESNTISYSEEDAISVDAGNIDEHQTGSFAAPSNNAVFDTGTGIVGFAPGLTIQNNVLYEFTAAGIHITGASNDDENSSPAAVTYTKIINNTIVGTTAETGQQGTGILVEDFATATIINNIVTFTNMGIDIDDDETSVPSVIGANLFQSNQSNGDVGNFPIVLDLSDPLFVSREEENFYLADNSRAIDSSLNSLADRVQFVTIRNSIGMPNSDTVAPTTDRYNDLRVDDSSQSPPPGLGANIFKDRGALERSDVTGPAARISGPASSVYGSDPTEFVVSDPQSFDQITIDLTDNGTGIDDATVNASQIILTRQTNSTAPIILEEGIDYYFTYNAATDQILLTSASGLFQTDAKYTVEITDDDSPISDLAGNALLSNQTDPEILVEFSLYVADGINQAPVNVLNGTPLPDDPNKTVSTDSNVPLVFSSANGNAITISDRDEVSGYEVNDFSNPGEYSVTLTTQSGTLSLSTSATLIPDVDTGTTLTLTGTIADINTSLDGLTWTATAEYYSSKSGVSPASIQITTTEVTAKPGLVEGDVAKTDTDVIEITVNDPKTISFSSVSYSGYEDDGTITVTLTREATDAKSYFNLILTQGTATVADGDYVNSVVQPVEFPENELTFTIDITITDDNVVEADETFFLQLQDLQDQTGPGYGNAFVDTQTATVTILNDDTATISVADVEVNESAGDVLPTTSFVLNYDSITPEMTLQNSEIAGESVYGHVAETTKGDYGSNAVFFIYALPNLGGYGTLGAVNLMGDPNVTGGTFKLHLGEYFDSPSVTLNWDATPEDIMNALYELITTDERLSDLDPTDIIVNLYESSPDMQGQNLTYPEESGSTDLNNYLRITFNSRSPVQHIRINSAGLVGGTYWVQDESLNYNDVPGNGISVADGTPFSASTSVQTPSGFIINFPEYNDIAAEVSHYATAAEIQAALEAIPEIGVGNVIVEGSLEENSGSTGGGGGGIRIEFTGDLGLSEIPYIGFSPNVPSPAGFNYVTRKSHGGETGSNEVQSLSLPKYLSGGTFTLSFEGEETTPLSYNASNSDIKAALEALSTIGTGNVLVSGGNINGADVSVTFVGDLSKQDVSSLIIDGSNLNFTTPQSVPLSYVDNVWDPISVNYSTDISTFTITFNESTTAALPVTTTADQVEAALQAIGAYNVDVMGSFATGNMSVHFLDSRAYLDVSEGPQTIEVTVSIDKLLINESEVDVTVDQDLLVTYKLVSDSAEKGLDFAETVGTVIIPANADSATILIPLGNDTLIEPTEEFNVVLLDVTAIDSSGTPLDRNATLNATTANATVTIKDDDAAIVSINAQAFDEDAGTVTITVSIDKALDYDLTADYEFVHGLTNALDYNVDAASGSLIIPQGSTSVDFTLTILDDSFVEENETFDLLLSNFEAGGLSLNDGNQSTIETGDTLTGTFSIINNDSASLSIQQVTVPPVSEGSTESATTSYVYSVTLTGNVQDGLTLSYHTDDNTATTGANDYLDNDGNLTFSGISGESKTITVLVNQDTQLESDEIFDLFLGSISNVGATTNAAISVQSAPVSSTIVNDDTATLSVLNVSMEEADEGATLNYVFNVVLSNAVQGGLEINYTTQDNTASSATDYTATSGMLTFAGTAGEIQTITVAVNGDDLVEPDELFDVVLSNLNMLGTADPSDLTIYNGVGMIENTDVSLVLDTVDSLLRSEDTPGVMTFTVTLSEALNTDLTVDIDLIPGTADASDYLPVTMPVTFAAGETTQTFTVTLVDDGLVESDETFAVSLGTITTSSTNNIFADSSNSNDSVEITIEDDDAATVSISDVTVDEDAGIVTLTVSLSYSVDTDVSIDFATADGTANDLSDYMSKTGTITIDAFTASQTFTIPISDDVIIENNEQFYVNLSNIQANSLPVTFSDSQAVVTITEDDTATLSIADASVDEETGQITFLITATGNIQDPFNATFSTADQASALAGTDYVLLDSVNYQLDFSSSLTDTVTVTIINDNTVEVDETFLLNITALPDAPAGVTIADSQAIGTIENNDEATLSIADVTVDEDAGTATLTVSLSNLVDTDISIDYATADGTASVLSDYSATNGTVTIDANTLSKTFTIPIIDNVIIESNEQFYVNLSNLQANSMPVMLGDTQATVTIDDDDAATASIADVVVDEDAGTVTLTVSLSNPVDTDITIDYATADGTASDLSDFSSTTGTVTIDAFTTSQTFTIPISDDVIIENNEQFYVNLSNIQANSLPVTFSDSQAVVTITEDDTATLSIADASVDEETGQITFLITATGNIQDPFNATFSTADQASALAGTDYVLLDSVNYQLDFSSSLTDTVTVTIIDDNTVEVDETFLLNITALPDAPAGVTIADSQAVGTIDNNNDTATLSIADASANEATGQITFTVTASDYIQEAFTADFTTADESTPSAVADTDYTTLNSPDYLLDFSSSLTQTITVSIIDDDIVELDEILLLNMTNLQGVITGDLSISEGEATGTIINDESAYISIADVTENEGHSGELPFVFTISLDKELDADVTFLVNTLLDGSNTSAAADFIDLDPKNQSYTIRAGDISIDVSINVNGDAGFELDETFFVQLSSIDAEGRDVRVPENHRSDVGLGTAGAFSTTGSANDIEIAGNIAYVADGSAGLRVLDISDLDNIIEIGHYDTSEDALVVRVSGSTAFVAVGDAGLIALDVSDPGSGISLLGSYNSPGEAQDIQISGTTAYLADGSAGLLVLDISDLDIISLSGAYDTPGSASAVQVTGTTAYIADGDAGLIVLDVTNPSSGISMLGSFDTSGQTLDVEVSGTTAYLADGSSGLKELDISDLDIITQSNSIPLPSGHMLHSIELTGHFALVAVGGSALQGLLVYDLSDNSNGGGDWRVKRTHFGAEMGPTWGWVNHVG
ncbi:Calx-beta domain-containing protein [Gimesia algae]|uniref:Calx-beta domain protein n=1 Tax=Gimesia algae TaxID=2527971 RepID=A0A517VA40_9PLAN|nr:Calx-beta domain-containing protein [Gimesia algae]QDT89881.1 Calx-beta domain protein [Gimesia algae]